MALGWRVVVAALVSSMATGSTVAQPVVDGAMLTTKDGFTLYTFDNDVVGSGKSSCIAPCSGLHPPYLVEDGAKIEGDYSLILREDGTKQWAYRGKPLYRFYADEKRGDKLGDGLSRNTWHVARP